MWNHKRRDENGKVVLVVEDQDDTRAMYTFALQHAGYRVVCADSMACATALLRLWHFDVVVTDYSLGDGTGLDVLKVARAEDLLRETRAIMCTGNVDVVSPHEVPLLHKPVTLEALVDAVDDNSGCSQTLRL